MTRWLCCLLFAACEVKQPLAPSYFHAKPPQPAMYASCQDTSACYPQCNPPSEECMTACDQRTKPATADHARQLESCLREARCSDETCAQSACGPQLAACTAVREPVQQ